MSDTQARDALAAALPCEDPEEPCDQDGRDEHRWCDYCIARSVLARVTADQRRALAVAFLDEEALAAALFVADRPSPEWPTWDEYLASFGHNLSVDDAWKLKAAAILAALQETP